MITLKKYFGSICCMVIAIVGIVTAYAGYNCGPNKGLYFTTSTSTFKITGTLSNDTIAANKQVYARAGSKGSYSDYSDNQPVGSRSSISHSDGRGITEPSYYEAKPCWIYKGTRSCSYGD